jgi:hypothetical protein
VLAAVLAGATLAPSRRATAASCDPGLTWCSLSGRCVNPACLSCCQFGTTCAMASDCGKACVTCADGSSSCSAGQCGTELAGQCFYTEPTCPAPPAVPAMPLSLTLCTGALGLLGACALVRRSPR